MGAYRKLSLLSQYDDICRHLNGLTEGCEKEFKIYLNSQKHFRQKIRILESKNEELEQKVKSLDVDKMRLEAQVKHSRNVLVVEIKKSQKLELEKNSLERQIALIKELLTDQHDLDHSTKEKLFLLSSATSQHNDLLSTLKNVEESATLLESSDWDETSDDLDSCALPPKPSSKFKTNFKNMEKKTLTGSSTYSVNDDPYSQDDTTIRRQSMITFRSSSEPNSTSPEKPLPRPMIRSDSEHIREHVFDERKSFRHNRSSLPNGRSSIGGKLSKEHTFQIKTFIRSEKCHPCGKIIKFCKQGAKCSVCKMSCHSECKEQCPLPCIPAVTNQPKGLGNIADYTSSTSPMIPSLIIHCVNEIEARGLHDIGLYRVPGREREIKELKEKLLKGKTVPSLKENDIHAICGTVKEFLRSLKDSLIPNTFWHTFVEAASVKDEKTKLNFLHKAVCDLPQPNKETLAYLILHLQRVAASPLCKMPLKNLSKVFAPTIVGYSADEQTDINMFSETQQQNKVMEGLLNISEDWWQNLFSSECRFFSSKGNSPERLTAPTTSRLGPITTSSSSLSIPAIVKASLSPRRAGRRQFLSPILKN